MKRAGRVLVVVAASAVLAAACETQGTGNGAPPGAPTKRIPVSDPPNDTRDCKTGTAIGGRPQNDILEVTVIGGGEQAGGEVVVVGVNLAGNAKDAFENEFSWAILVQKTDKDGKVRTFILEIHKGKERRGELDANGNVIPGTENRVSFTKGVGFSIDQRFEDTLTVEVFAFNTPEDGDRKSCDTAGVDVTLKDRLEFDEVIL